MNPTKGVILTVLLLLLSACSSVEYYPLEENVNKEKDTSQAPLPLKVAVLPLKVGYKPTEELKDTETFRVPLEKDKFLRTFTSLLEEHPLFAAPKGGKAVEIYEEKENLTQIDYMKRAWKEQKDLLLEMEVEEYKLSYEGVSTGLYLTNLMIWAYAWIPHWWVADEIYQAELKMKLRVYSVHSRKLLAEYQLPLTEGNGEEKPRKDYLNDWDRGWKFLGIFTVPSYLSKSNWETVRETMAAWVEQKKRYEFWNALNTRFRKDYEGGKFRQNMEKTLALAVGISRYKDSFIQGERNYSFNDANALSKFLLPRVRELKKLTDQRATKQSIYREIDHFLKPRSRGIDTVIFYFAGYGVAAKGDGKTPRLYLIPHDASLSRLADTAIDLSKLLEKLSAIQSQKTWIILDTSFGLPSQWEIDNYSPEDGPLNQGRSLTFLWNQRSGESNGQKQVTVQGLKSYSLPSLPSRVTVVLPCEVTQISLELPENQRGLFNYYFLTSLEKALEGKKDRAKEILFSQLYQQVRRDVKAQSRKRFGFSQEVNCWPRLPSRAKWKLGKKKDSSEGDKKDSS